MQEANISEKRAVSIFRADEHFSPEKLASTSQSARSFSPQ
jgi:hypothetical protein